MLPQCYKHPGKDTAIRVNNKDTAAVHTRDDVPKEARTP
jgi:hypothetical protein